MKVVCLDRGERCLCMAFRQEDGERYVLIYTRKEQLRQYLRKLGGQAFRAAGLCRFHAAAGLDWERFAKEIMRSAVGKGVVGIMGTVAETARVSDSGSHDEVGLRLMLSKPVHEMDYGNLFFCYQGGPYICDSEVVARKKGGKVLPFSCSGAEELSYLVAQTELGLRTDGHLFSFSKMILYVKQRFSGGDVCDLCREGRALGACPADVLMV